MTTLFHLHKIKSYIPLHTCASYAGCFPATEMKNNKQEFSEFIKLDNSSQHAKHASACQTLDGRFTAVSCLCDKWFEWCSVYTDKGSMGLRKLRCKGVYSIRKDFVCVEVLRPSQLIRVMSSLVSLPNHTFFWKGLILKATYQYLCTFFRQKLITAPLESAERREQPQKIFHDQSPQKNVTRSGYKGGICSFWVYSLGKEFAPSRSKFFPYRIDPNPKTWSFLKSKTYFNE